MAVLDGMVAVVAGGSRGVGRGCALELAAQGALVYVAGRTLHEGDGEFAGSLTRTVEEAAELGGRAVPVVCDLRDDEAVAALFARVRGEQGRLDVLVNAAFLLPEGTVPDTPFWETPISYWDDLLDVGPRGAYACTWHAAQVMVPAGRGLIANISSLGARQFFVHPTYGIAKSALDRVTRDTALQLRPHGVAVVSLWPYFVLTERILSFDAEEWDLDIDGAESPRFPGRAVAALATAPDVLDRSGRAFTTRQIADAYGFTDVDGRLPTGSEEPIAEPV